MKTKNDQLFNRAKKYFVAGVNSPVRSFNYVGGNPILIKEAKGSGIYDYDGKRYIDYMLSYGAIILGHANPLVVKETQRVMKNGFGFGTTTLQEIELASIIQKAIPNIKKIRFVNSGTEAVMSVVRLARAYTARNKIVKFTNSYHGHADSFLVKAGSGLSSFGIALSKGIPNDVLKHTIIVDFGDQQSIDEIFKKFGAEIAAVIVEPVGGNYGVVPPDSNFLKYLRKITREYGSLLIFDEIITGFRFSFGCFADRIGIIPDLICMGKIIGGGLPIGAYAGKQKIMDNLVPLGGVYQASTFAGNPVVMQSGIATLRKLSALKKEYRILSDKTERLSGYIEDEAKRNGIILEVSYYATMFSVKFHNKRQFQYFHRAVLENGIYFTPSEYEVNFVSFAHTDYDIYKTQKIVKRVFKDMKNKRGIL